MSRDRFVRINGDRINGLFHLPIDGLLFGLYIPGTQMTLVLIGKGLVLEGWPSKIEVSWVLDIYIYPTDPNLLLTSWDIQVSLFYTGWGQQTRTWVIDFSWRHETCVCAGSENVCSASSVFLKQFANPYIFSRDLTHPKGDHVIRLVDFHYVFIYIYIIYIIWIICIYTQYMYSDTRQFRFLDRHVTSAYPSPKSRSDLISLKLTACQAPQNWWFPIGISKLPGGPLCFQGRAVWLFVSGRVIKKSRWLAQLSTDWLNWRELPPSCHVKNSPNLTISSIGVCMVHPKKLVGSTHQIQNFRMRVALKARVINSETLIKFSSKNIFSNLSRSVKRDIPSRKLTYPTWGKGKSSSNMPY